MRRAPAPGLLLPPPSPLLLLLGFLVLDRGCTAQYSSDLCSWRGSGLTHESHRKDVEQVYLRCSEGTIEWMYPTGALIVNLRPNIISSSYKHWTVCIKPYKNSAGANIYLEKTGELKLLVQEGDHRPTRVYCFNFDQGGLFVEATPQQDISRKITSFQYELISKGMASDLHMISAPANLAVTRKFSWLSAPVILFGESLITNGGVKLERYSYKTIKLLFLDVHPEALETVVRGTIQSVINEEDQQDSIISININRIYRQKTRIFNSAEESGRWQGQIKTLLQCGVKPGEGDFLFTGSMHFGEVRLGCAPRFKDFQRMYKEAKDKGLNPCEIGPD